MYDTCASGNHELIIHNSEFRVHVDRVDCQTYQQIAFREIPQKKKKYFASFLRPV